VSTRSGVATRHEPVSVLYTGSPTAVGLADFSGIPAAGPSLAGLAALALAVLGGVALRRRR
jgi:MYXO-CTERM domain-containing protein